MYVLENLHWFLLFIVALVFVHELGHFLAAKAVGIKVEKFSIGFGPRLFGFFRGETEYAVSALPLGGYVKMLGEVPGSEIPPEDLPRAFGSKKVWERALVVAAGPVFNFALALVVYFGMFLGPQTFGDTRLGLVTPGEPAWQAGLRPGDKVLAVDGKLVRDWNALREAIGTRPGHALSITFERGGATKTVEVLTAAKTENNVFQELETRGRIGVSLQYLKPVLAVVDPDSPAAKAGLATGDELTHVQGRAVGAWHEVREALAGLAPQGPVQLRYTRGGVAGEAQLVAEAPIAAVPEGIGSSADPAGAYTGLTNRDALIAEVEPGTPAAEVGLRVGDRLLAIAIERDGQKLLRPINAWAVDLAALSGLDARSRFTLQFQRGREVMTAELALLEREATDELKNVHKQFVFGAKNDPSTMATYTYDREVGAAEALKEATLQVASDMTLIAKGLSKLASGDIPLDTVGGPIMLFVIAEKSARRGWGDYLRMMAVISVNLGLMNLLPVPVLDGGHLVFLGFEALRRRPPSLRVREVANMVGFALLMMLMVLVFKNDLLRYVLG